MNTKQHTIGIICGGQSVEHSISLWSATNVAKSLDQHYQLIIIYIDQQGNWHHIIDKATFLNNKHYDANSIQALESEPLLLAPNDKQSVLKRAKDFQSLPVDLFFPILHGTQGEDGSIQGLLEFLNQPFIGNSIAGSAIAMNKILSKQLLSGLNIPTLPYMAITENSQFSNADIIKTLGLPLFIKPAHLGSSIGITKVTNEKTLRPAISKALALDTHVLVEKGIQAREIECAVVKTEKGSICAIPGEVIPMGDFYSFSAKYQDPDGAKLICPARLSDLEKTTVVSMAKQCFDYLQLEGFARIDFFLSHDGHWYFNEANPIPGFTQISMFSRCFKESGKDFLSLLQLIINQALHQLESKKNQTQLSDENIIKV